MRKACANLKKTQTPEIKNTRQQTSQQEASQLLTGKGGREGRKEKQHDAGPKNQARQRQEENERRHLPQPPRVLLCDRQGDRECHGTEDQDAEQSLYGQIVLKRLFPK